MKYNKKYYFCQSGSVLWLTVRVILYKRVLRRTGASRSSAFYALLCIFSIVTGLMYASGRKALNPLELSDSFMSRYSDPEKLKAFTIKMGWVTFYEKAALTAACDKLCLVVGGFLSCRFLKDGISYTIFRSS